MDSLYGGRPGTSFVLKEGFETIEDMSKAFKKGNAYTDVWYGEYCIIDTVNKNNPQNGMVFQRSLDYSTQKDITIKNEVFYYYGAKYIGQIVGPQSGTPYISIGSILATQEKITKGTFTEGWDYVQYPNGTDSDGDGILTPDEVTVGTDFYDVNNSSVTTPNIIVASTVEKTYSGSIDNSVISVPGKYTNTNNKSAFNDTIKYTWCNIRTVDNEDDVSECYIGIQIPYLVEEIESSTVSQYDDNGNWVENSSNFEHYQSTAGINDDADHPFWNKWHIKIPKGVKGDSFRNFRVIEVDSNSTDIIYYFPTNIIAETDKVDLTKLTQYSLPSARTNFVSDDEDDITSKRSILVCDWYYFDNKQEGQKITIYLGDYNTIENVSVTGDGSIKIDYTYNDYESIDQKLNWITNIELNANTGKFTVNTNNDNIKNISKILSFVKYIDIAENGTITLYYADGKTENRKDALDSYQEELDTKLKSVEGASFDSETGTFTFDLNTGESVTITGDKIRYPISITMPNVRPENGTGTNLDGTTYTTYYPYGSTEYTAYLEKIKQLAVNYNIKNTDGSITELIDEALNEIDKVIVSNNYHLLVLYTDPSRRAVSTGSETNPQYLTPDGQEFSIDANSYYDKKNKITWSTSQVGWWQDQNTLIWWQDLGSFKEYNGLLVGISVTPDEVQAANYASIITYLNGIYPDGLTEPNEGRVVIYGNEDDVKTFYGYDYNTHKWTLLGALDESGAKNIIVRDANEAESAITQILGTDGIILLSDDYSVSARTLETPWIAA